MLPSKFTYDLPSDVPSSVLREDGIDDPGNLYTKTLLYFLQLFIVSNCNSAYAAANNNDRHFAFNADERFLPVYECEDEDNRKIRHLSEFAANLLQAVLKEAFAPASTNG